MKKSREDIYAEEVLSEADEEYGDEEIYDDMLEEYSEDYDSDDGGRKKKKGGPEQKKNAHVMARINREKAKKEKERKQWEFPQKIGSHYSYINPALEFSKFITTHVFGLDESFHLESHQIKMNLLRMIHCKEFSPEAQEGIEPSLILVIPNVICEQC